MLSKLRNALPQWMRRSGRSAGAVAAPTELSEGEFRELLKSLAAPGVKALSIRDFFANGEVGFKQLTSYESILRYGTSKLWASWKACDLVAQEVMRTTFDVRRGNREDPIQPPRGMDVLLEYPNESMTFAELLYLTVMHVKFVGNSYWYKAEAQAGTFRRPGMLIPVNPSRVTIRTDPQTGAVIGYTVSGITKDGKPGLAPYDVGELVHFKRPHPNNDYYGLGDLEAGQALGQSALSAVDADESSHKNGAVPTGVLVKKTDYPTSPTEWKELKAKWQAEYGGANNAGKIGWLGGEWSYLRLGLTPAEMAKAEMAKLTRDDIFALHGVPLSVAGVKDAANYATAQVDDVRFRSYAVAPMVKIVQDTFNTDIAPDWGDGLKLVFNVTGLINIGATLESILPAFDRGIVSINEVRAMIGLKTNPDNPLWSEHYINAGLTPLSLAGLANADTAADTAKAIVQRFIAGTSQPPPKP